MDCLYFLYITLFVHNVTDVNYNFEMMLYNRQQYTFRK